MLHPQQTPHNIKIRPAITICAQSDQQRTLSRITDEVYQHLLRHATFAPKSTKGSSRFITRQRIAEKLRFNLWVINRSIHELIHAKRLQPHRDGYLVLIKEESV
ncbi:unnamed protein product [Commensalibacter communis]|uniref:Uncharacterized protein n=2 Tax=Commensalibacter communis TaxID=2972786 RepID=A0A9W4TPP7_9PROT|nr:hypothetical protein [Commensalibacter communis]CAI3960708.1 unnamed protein product [Commensalibacter communis]